MMYLLLLLKRSTSPALDRSAVPLGAPPMKAMAVCSSLVAAACPARNLADPQLTSEEQ
jgi:hypothetical protein